MNSNQMLRIGTRITVLAVLGGVSGYGCGENNPMGLNNSEVEKVYISDTLITTVNVCQPTNLPVLIEQALKGDQQFDTQVLQNHSGAKRAYTSDPVAPESEPTDGWTVIEETPTRVVYHRTIEVSDTVYVDCTVPPQGGQGPKGNRNLIVRHTGSSK